MHPGNVGGDPARCADQDLHHESRVDVLMCENDILALGAMDVIRSEFGLRIPQDVAVVGFDNIELGEAPAYELTSYQQPTEAMINALVAMITGKDDSETVVMPGRLVLRSSA
ncbi:substrate-binding domain-containing protein [Rhizobium ruizarguesonis]